MSKRILSLLLVIAVLATLVVVPANAWSADENVTAESALCPCGCGKTLDAVTWQPWLVNTLGAPTSGHYYLDGNYTQTKQQTIMAGDRVVLDLRGNTITSKEYGRLLLVYGHMHVLDTVGGGRFMSKTSGTGYGGIVMVSTNEVNDSVFELCSGTMTPDPDNKGSRRGGLVQVSGTATFRMTGGMLLNGSTVNGTHNEPGGCVAAADAASTIEILGGSVVGGESATYGGNIYSAGTTILKNCSVIGGVGVASGGNIFQDGGTLLIENCTISDGVCGKDGGGGGNIGLISGAQLTLKNSTVRNGWSAYHGGNIYIGKGTALIENTELYSGVAYDRGGNIYGSTASVGLTIKDCTIPGDVFYIGGGLQLTGQVKIGLLNNGLRIYAGDYKPTMDASGLTEGSEIYVFANQVFADTSANPAYFKGALRTVLTETAEGIKATLAASGTQGGYCPHCNKQVVWTAFSVAGSHVQNCLQDSADDTDPACTGNHIENGHYYLTADITSMAQQYIGIYITGSKTVAAKDVVIDLAGYDITTAGRSFYLRPANTDAGVPVSSLTLLDSLGGSVVTGSGANNQGGGVLYNEGSSITLYGGNYVYKNSGKNVTGGGILTTGNCTIHGGTYDASAFTYTDKSTTDKTYAYTGGVIQTTSSKTVTITAGRFIGGVTQKGGTVYFGANNVINITGGQFCGGVANQASGGGGGCIRAYGSSSSKKNNYKIEKVSIRDGSVTGTSAGGGNLSLGYGTFTFNECYIEGGTVVGYGGNATLGTSGNITFTDCIIEGGSSQAQSGNIHVSATSAKTNYVDCLILNGVAKTYGGNITTGNGENIISGGQILFGKAGTYGGNITNSAGNNKDVPSNFSRIQADANGNVTLVAAGTAGTNGGNIYNGAVLDLRAVQVRGGKAGTAGQDMYQDKGANQSKLTVGEGVTGDISIHIVPSLLGTKVFGEPVDRTVCSTMNANMVLEGNYDNAPLVAKDGVLYVGSIAVYSAEGQYTWFADAESAMAACGETDQLKLFVATDLVLTKDVTVDIFGNTISISGPYTATIIDSAGGGQAALAEETKTPDSYMTPEGVRYVYVKENGVLTAHGLDMRISSVSLRTGNVGMYYNATWSGDEVISAMISGYGIALSTFVVPNENFRDAQQRCIWTENVGAFTDSAAQSSVIVANIMKTTDQDPDRTAEQNKANGETKVYAAAYVELTDGTILLSNPVAYSLYDVMHEVDDRLTSDPINYRKYTNTMRAFYKKWESFGMGQWEFNKAQTPADDGVIDVLMIGSSFCYYYVEELAGLAEAAGLKMRVCNVYYSGCPLEKHYRWWINGEANYQFFDTTTDKGRLQTNNVSLEWCLAQGEWDVISLQQSTSATVNDPNHLETTRLYYTTLLNYLMEQFPNARMMWHQPWTYQIGYDRDGVQITKPEEQQAREDIIKAYCVAICEEFGIERVNTGEAWQIVRTEYGYDNLCARLGKGSNHEGDYYHDGDIGGGQYLNACVWFEVITGISPVGNTYAPTYKYNGTTYYLDSDITFLELQQAAHAAVEQMRAEEAAK